MKRLILAATAAVLMSTAAHAENYITLYKGEHWETIDMARNTEDIPMCVLTTTVNFPRGAYGSLHIKQASEGGLLMQLAKTTWKMAPDRVYPIVLKFNTSRGEELTWEGKLTSYTYERSPYSGMVIYFTDEEAPNFLAQFRIAEKMTVTFKGSNEATWIAGMKGSRRAAEAFKKCVQGLPPAEEAQDKPSAEKRGAITSRPNQRASQ